MLREQGTSDNHTNPTLLLQVGVYVYVITPFGVVLPVYPPDYPRARAPEGGGRINRNTTTKGVIKCLLPVARLRDAFATRARPETAILRLRSQRDG